MGSYALATSKSFLSPIKSFASFLLFWNPVFDVIELFWGCFIGDVGLSMLVRELNEGAAASVCFFVFFFYL